MRVVDVHSHYVPRAWPDLEQVTGAPGWPTLRVETEHEAMIMLGSREFRRITAQCWDADLRLADMDADDVDLQVVSPTPVFFNYARPADQAAKVARIMNDLALGIVSPCPERLVAFAQVPLQDTDAACAEAERCLANGHLGVEIGNHVGDRDLDDAGIVTFLQHCAAIGMPVFVHPWDMPSTARTDRWMAQWLVGMPAETHLSILAMILGGAFDQISPDLRICFAHGGGSFAMWLGRVENAWHRRPDAVATSAQPPSAYLDRFSVDSWVASEDSLRLLLEVHGAEHVMLGSDYPYPLGEERVGALVRHALMPEHDRALILGGNATAFLGMVPA